METVIPLARGSSPLVPSPLFFKANPQPAISIRALTGSIPANSSSSLYIEGERNWPIKGIMHTVPNLSQPFLDTIKF